MDEQSLLRRGQLRQLLAVLRDDDPGRFIQAVRDILGSTDVRYHLQHLTLQFLGHLPDPKPQEVDLVAGLLNDAAWRDAVVSQVVAGHSPWFHALDASGFWQEWLGASESWKIDVACGVLRSIAESAGDRVAELLSPYENGPEPWPHRIANVLPWLPNHDSEKLFELRLQFLRNGLPHRPDFLFSEELVDRAPDRLVDLLVTMLEREMEQEKPPQPNSVARHEDWPFWLPHQVAETLLKAAEKVPEHFWQRLLPFVLAAVQDHPATHPEWDDAPYVGDGLWQDDHYKHKHTGARPLPELIAIAGGWLARADSSAVAASLKQFTNHPSRTVQKVVGSTWLHGPDSVADAAIQWLIEDPRRFCLGHVGEDKEWRLARDLVARYASLCSTEVYGRLERALLSYYPRTERERYQRRLESYGGGRGHYRANHYGLLQHALLAALPTNRRSSIVVNVIGQFWEKFKRPAEEIEGDDGPKGGFVTSPISSHPERLSDNAWLQLMSSMKCEPRFEHARWFDGHVLESSPEQFSHDLRRQAEREPQRFAALALRVPLDALPCYWAALLDALRLTKPPDQAPDSWQPASHAQCHAVLGRVRYQEHREIALSFCRCIDERPDCGWPLEIVQTLCRYAGDHPDPGDDGQVMPADAEDRLDIEAINTVRGRAAEAISALLFEDRSLFSSLQPSLERLIRDPVASIRVAALAAILPVLKIDPNQAVEWFLRACEGTSDEVLASRNAREFLRYTIRSHGSRLEETFDRMIKSSLPVVTEEGAAWTTIAWLYAGRRASEFKACVSGSPAHRKGVAQVLSGHLAAR